MPFQGKFSLLSIWLLILPSSVRKGRERGVLVLIFLALVTETDSVREWKFSRRLRDVG